MGMLTVFRLAAVLVLLVMLPCGAETEKNDGAISREQIRQWIGELGAKSYADREAATRNLMEAGARAVEDAREALDEAEDPEVRHRLRKILYTATLQVGFEDLSPQAKDIARLPFETAIIDQGTRAQRRTYSVGDYGISDIGNIRVAVSSWPFSGRSSSTVTIKGASGGSGATGNGKRRFTTSSSNGVSVCTFAELSFTAANGSLQLDGREFAFGKAQRVLFVTPKGKVEGIFQVGTSTGGESDR